MAPARSALPFLVLSLALQTLPGRVLGAGAAQEPETKEARAARLAVRFDESMRRLLEAPAEGTAFLFADSSLDLGLGAERNHRDVDWAVQARDSLFLRGTFTGRNLSLRYGSRLDREATFFVSGTLASESTLGPEGGVETGGGVVQPKRPGPPVTCYAVCSGALDFSVGKLRVAFAPSGALIVTDEKDVKKRFDSMEEARRSFPPLVRLIGKHWLQAGLDKGHLAALSYVALLRQVDFKQFSKAFARVERRWTLPVVEERLAGVGKKEACTEHLALFRTDEDRARAEATALAGRREAEASESLKQRLGQPARVGIGGAPVDLWAAIFSQFAEVEVEVADEVKGEASWKIVGEADADLPLRDYLSAVLAAADLDWRAKGDKVLVVGRTR